MLRLGKYGLYNLRAHSGPELTARLSLFKKFVLYGAPLTEKHFCVLINTRGLYFHRLYCPRVALLK